jgi:hypothetical protein
VAQRVVDAPVREPTFAEPLALLGRLSTGGFDLLPFPRFRNLVRVDCLRGDRRQAMVLKEREQVVAQRPPEINERFCCQPFRLPCCVPLACEQMERRLLGRLLNNLRLGWLLPDAEPNSV